MCAVIIAEGRAVSPGIAAGPIFLLHRRPARAAGARSELTPEQELVRLEEALAGAKRQLRDLRAAALDRAGEESAAIFDIHAMMLEDEDFLEPVRRSVRAGAAAEHAVRSAGEALAADFSALDDPYLRARAADVEDVADRVVRLLTGERAELELPGPCILLADDLTPGETVSLDRDRLLGIVTRRGSADSHTAILARTMGIPALVGVRLERDWNGRPAALDCEGGRLYIDPDPDTLAGLASRQRAAAEEEEALRDLRERPSVTRDGRELQILANAGSLADVELALRNGAQGIGLFRSEFLYLGRPDCPGEEEQFSVYRQAAQAMGGRQVIIRTLDIGADKRAECLNLPPEENPALGLRAIRLCLCRRDLFRTQLRAILRASAYGHVAVMFPLIISAEEMRRAREMLAACRRELEEEGVPLGTLEVGAMVETPAAALTADELAREADFFSIGTNDLTQYTLALDRQNPELEPFRSPCHPAVLELICRTAEAARRRGIRWGICGGLGGDQAMTGTFLRLGVSELSVPPGEVLSLRRHVRSLDLGEKNRQP